MIFDAAVQQGLSNRRVINFAMPMAAKADEINHNISFERIAIFSRQSRYAHHRIRIFSIHVKDGNVQSLGGIAGEARGVQFLRLGSESDEVVGDDMDGAADVIPFHPSEVEGLGDDTLTRKGRVAMHE